MLDELQAFEIGQELSRFGQRGCEDRLCDFQKVEDPRICHRVAHRGSLFTALQDIRPPEDSELLGQVRSLEPHLGDQFTNRTLPVAQQLENPYTRRMRKRLKEVSLHLVDRPCHRRQPSTSPGSPGEVAERPVLGRLLSGSEEDINWSSYQLLRGASRLPQPGWLIVVCREARELPAVASRAAT